MKFLSNASPIWQWSIFLLCCHCSLYQSPGRKYLENSGVVINSLYQVAHCHQRTLVPAKISEKYESYQDEKFPQLTYWLTSKELLVQHKQGGWCRAKIPPESHWQESLINIDNWLSTKAQSVPST